MVMRKIDVMLFRMIKNSIGQFLAVLVIIIVGIGVFTSLNMTSVNMKNTVDSYYKENHFADIFIQMDRLPFRSIDQIERLPGITKAEGRISMDVPVITEELKNRVTLRLITTTDQEEGLNKSTILEGRNIAAGTGKEIVLIEQFAHAREIEIGDIIRVQAGGTPYALKVAGIAANPEYIYLMENSQSIMPDEENFGVGYISEGVGRQVAGLSGGYNELIVKTEKGIDEDRLIENIESLLDQYGIKQIVKRENQISNSIIQEELKNLNAMANSLPILFLLVAGLILMMMLARMVKKDRLKIGVLKSMGYRNSQVISHYAKYAGLSGLIGGFIGSVSGMALSGAMTHLYLQYFHIPLLKVEFYYSYIALAIVLSLGFCIVSGVIGARGVMKIAPADAMRTEAPKAGKRILLEKIPYLWKRLSFSNKMVIRNVFRNKKRTLFILTGVVLTYAMMVFSTSMPDVIDQMMNRHFTEFQRMDYNISFQKPVHKNAVRDLGHLIDADYMEGKIEYPFKLTNGNKNKSANIIGLSENTRFYSFQDINGKALDVPNNGILLSENLAYSLDVKEGDMLRIESFLPDKADVYIPVKGIINQTLGMNGYMEMNHMNRVLLEPNMITGVYLNSSDPNITKKLMSASNIGTIMSVSDIRKVYENYMQTIVLSIGFMILFSGILGFSIVYNATMVSINEREMELSSLRVLGFSKGEIFMMILRENNIIMIAGILLGIPVGKLFSMYSTIAFSTDLYRLDMSPTLGAGITAALFTIGFIITAQAAAYRRIKGLDFLKALKNREG